MVLAPRAARLLASFLVTALMALAGAAASWAAEANATPNGAASASPATEPVTPDGEAGEQDNAPTEGEKPASGDQSTSTEVFVPSEEISEDFTVSFPVDI